jgi:hypothetical protein
MYRIHSKSLTAKLSSLAPVVNRKHSARIQKRLTAKSVSFGLELFV